MDSNQRGFTLIEILIVVTIISVLILTALWAYRAQLMKGRDARRKADLVKIKNAMEDYLNDNVCYPDVLVSGDDFAPYLHRVPADPLNTGKYSYLYTYEESETCKSWYKIYTKLENEDDPIIEEVGCGPNDQCPDGGCGPLCNFNYWVSSANVTEVAQLPDEYWPPGIPGVTPPVVPTSPPGPTSTPVPGATSTPTPTATPTGGAGPTDTPTPTSTPPGPVPCGDNGWRPTSCGGLCVPFICSTCCPGVEYRCAWADGGPCCEPDPTCGQ